MQKRKLNHYLKQIFAALICAFTFVALTSCAGKGYVDTNGKNSLALYPSPAASSYQEPATAVTEVKADPAAAAQATAISPTPGANISATTAAAGNGQNSMSGNDDNSDESYGIWVAASDSVDLDGMNIYWQQDNLQFAADDKAELILYVGAEKDSKGNFVLDDSNSWLLLMETSLGKYLLLPKQNVRLGGVYCSAFNDADGNSHVIVTVQQTAAHQVYDCIFDNDAKEFQVKTVYDATGINLTMPERGK